MSGTDDDGFLLFNADIVPRLKDREFFKRAFSQFCMLTANQYGCEVTISDRRMGEAYDFWIGDVERALQNGTDEETTELDHFKHAAFIAFWLRRLIPINDIWFQATAGNDGCGASAPQVRFSRYGNEICALSAGFMICLSYELAAMEERETHGQKTQVISDAVAVKELPRHFLSEYPKLLKHKNLSPHSMYMLYRSLFDSLSWEAKGRAAAAS